MTTSGRTMSRAPSRSRRSYALPDPVELHPAAGMAIGSCRRRGWQGVAGLDQAEPHPGPAAGARVPCLGVLDEPPEAVLLLLLTAPAAVVRAGIHGSQAHTAQRAHARVPVVARGAGHGVADAVARLERRVPTLAAGTEPRREAHAGTSSSRSIPAKIRRASATRSSSGGDGSQRVSPSGCWILRPLCRPRRLRPDRG